MSAPALPSIGPWRLAARVVLAPMAGVTDGPFRMLCRRFGAGLAAAEMLTSETRLWDTPKSRRRRIRHSEPEPRVVQLVGADPEVLAEAARLNVAAGAQIIDINMGCPAKKVCGRACGSALLQDEPLVARILERVVQAAGVPVTLKIRTGWDRDNRNGVAIARIAEASGVAALAVHGRTRADRFAGEAEYETVRAIKAAVSLPVFANGDIDSPVRARAVLESTGADGVMIGRAAQGAPWIFRAVNEEISATSGAVGRLARAEVRAMILEHLDLLYALYGEETGVRMARKHLGWYCSGVLEGGTAARSVLMMADSTATQQALTARIFGEWAHRDTATIGGRAVAFAG